MFDRFAEAGGTFLDTADAYQFGQSEELVGKFIAADRDHFVLATKFTNGAGPQPGISTTGNSRKNMVASQEASLKRLGTDYIDLFWVHFPDDLTPMEEILRGLDDLVSSGKILHAALSNFPAWRVSRAATLADLKNWAPVAGIQIEYSLVERSADRELLPMAESLCGEGRLTRRSVSDGRESGPRRRPVVPARRRTAHRQVPPQHRGASDRSQGGHSHREHRPEDRRRRRCAGHRRGDRRHARPGVGRLAP